MKLLKLFNQFESLASAEAAPTTRRAAFGEVGRTLGKAATVALPLAAFLKPTTAFAQTSGNSVIEVLNYALTLEYLEAEFYQMGLDANSLLTGDMRETVALIARHEADHVNFLRTAISGSGGTPIDKPEFDFTAGGMFPTFSDTPTFLVLAQAFEDTGVRAYKGQATSLMGNGDVLTAALQIHSVEARHASEIRRMRDSKGWITGSMNSTGVAAADGVYAGENNVTHLGLDVTTVTQVNRDRVTQAWDEPLTMEAVLEIANPFLA
ncbi:ferritin-like domain-containing protein [Lewinella sp. IMCC34183]|uniref:ferritin-like domain-containing protein n=1 Tax=Lewinella sp. IMCC34183 TaxID=2248762 RepID=UPI000E24E600|nr:ferritin-like domain-containing protein [Lewinella sp. IMCC34183]